MFIPRHPRGARALGLAMLVAVGTLTAPAGHTAGVITECDTQVPMSDGVSLSANIQRPEGTARVPLILTSTGYIKDSGNNSPKCASIGGSMIARGYAVMIIDERGTGTSGGVWDMWGERTQRDYAELLDWVQRQPWSDGSVGVIGASYMAISSMFIAEADAARIAAGKPPAVRAVWAWTPVYDIFRDLAGPGGGSVATFYTAFVALMTGQNAVPPQDTAKYPEWASTYAGRTAGGSAFAAGLLTDLARGEHYDGPFWQTRSPATHAAEITAQVAIVGGWYDIFQRGEPLTYRAMTKSRYKKLWMGPSYHQGIPAAAWNAQNIGSQGAVISQWWEHWLHGVDNGVEKLPGVNLYQVGSETWRHGDAWPIPGTRYTPYYLGPGGSGTAQTSLNDGVLATGQGASGGDVLPMSQVGGGCSRSQGQWTAAGVTTGTPCDNDNRAAEIGALAYTSAPMSAPMEFTGPITGHLWATLLRPDATLVVTLTDVASDGSSKQITAGWLNAAQRAVDSARSWHTADTGLVVLPFHPFTRQAEQAAPLGEPVQLLVEVFPASYVLQPGHRLRVAITPGDAPHMTPSSTAAANGAGGAVTILRDAKHPSMVLLPIQPPAAG